MWGSLIAAGGSLLGGWLGQKNAEKNAQQQYQNQKEFAQQGISWKVQDAKNAGIHPIYALGAPTQSYAPVSIGDSLGSGIRQAGQDIGRAVNATSSPQHKNDQFTLAANSLALEKGSLENELLRSQVARIKQANNPAMPTPTTEYDIPGQGNAGPLIKTKPQEIIPSGHAGHAEPGIITDTGYTKTPTGHAWPVPSADIKQRIEDMPIQEAFWTLRNIFGPNWNPQPPPGYDHWNPVHGYGKGASPYQDFVRQLIEKASKK